MDKVIEYLMSKHYDRVARDYHRAEYHGEVKYDDDYEMDGRRGVRGSGRGRMRGRRRDRAHSADYDDYENDGPVSSKVRKMSKDYAYEDEKEEFREKIKYKMKYWIENLENQDGSDGPHFSKEKVCELADHMDLQMDEYGYDERDLYMAANMKYSDHARTLANTIPKEKELQKYVELARDFLEDEDSNLTGHDKLLMYYCDIVKFKG